MKKGALTKLHAIASRDLAKARAAADSLSIPKAYGSYEELLADPELEVIYIPLPNHLHVEWSARAARAGKHVLCEKPIAMSARDAEMLLSVQKETGKIIAEAFMVRNHPQWQQARAWVEQGRIGELVSAQCAFSYFNRDAANIRNKKDLGGGALYDGSARDGSSVQTTEFPIVDQYSLQSEDLSRAVRRGGPIQNSIDVAVGNMRVIDALFRSAESGEWQTP